MTTIGDRAFDNCQVVSVVIPEGVTYIGKFAFIFCQQMTSVVIPEGVTHIDTEAFAYCRSLTEITIPRSVTKFGSFKYEPEVFYDPETGVPHQRQVQVECHQIFVGNNSLKIVRIPKELKGGLGAIGWLANADVVYY